MLAGRDGAAAGDAIAGARLAAARCVSCHSSSEPIHSTLPLLEGQPKATFIAQRLPPRSPESSGSEAGRALADRLRCADCHGPALQGTNAGAARLAGQKARYTVWSESLAAHLALLR